MDITEQLTHESRIALAAAAEITRLRAEVEALRADALRFAWFSDYGVCVDMFLDAPQRVLLWTHDGMFNAWTFAEAIDAARAAQGCEHAPSL